MMYPFPGNYGYAYYIVLYAIVYPYLSNFVNNLVKQICLPTECFFSNPKVSNPKQEAHQTARPHTQEQLIIVLTIFFNDHYL